MSRNISDKTKQARGYGKGTGANYKPYIHTWEFNSRGTTSVIQDWKNGRGIHCMSQAEAQAYYLLRWDDGNVEIYEQYPLCRDDYDNCDTVAIAARFGLSHPGGIEHIMTTDFLAVRPDGNLHAYSVKPGRMTPAGKKSVFIEGNYWIGKGAEYTVLTMQSVNPVLIDNIRLMVEFYDERRVFDRTSAIKHKIATKQFSADLTSGILDRAALERIERENLSHIGREGYHAVQDRRLTGKRD